MKRLPFTTVGGAGVAALMNVQPSHRGSLHAEPASFYLGLALLASAFVLSVWRRRRRECRPLLRLSPPQTARR